MEFKGKWNIDFDKHQTVITNYNETKAIAFLPIASPETKANALLISKAPEMLEMLNDIKDYLGSDKRAEVEQIIKEATILNTNEHEI